jgi:hypothetical protein
MRNPYVRLVLILIVIAVVAFFAVRYITNLPTAEEKVFINLMRVFKRGNYDGMNELSLDGSFFQVLNKSKVFDTDGAEINWKAIVKLWSDAILRDAIETYIRAHVGKIDFRLLSTQRLDGGASAVVHFLIDFTVRDYTGSGNILAPEIYNGSAEGDVFLKRAPNGSMLIERIDFTLYSPEGMNLKKYLHQI